MAKDTAKEKKEIRKLERRKALIKNVNEFLDNNFKWFIILVVVIILLSGYFFLLKPKRESSEKMLRVINQKREEDYYNKKEELKKIKDLLLVYSRISSSYIDKINSIAPPDIDDLFTEMNQLISNQGLFVQSLNINKVNIRDPKLAKKNKNDQEYSEEIGGIKVSISVRGTDYEAFKNLLHSLENNLRLIDVERVDFDPKSQSTKLLLSTYYTKKKDKK